MVTFTAVGSYPVTPFTGAAGSTTMVVPYPTGIVAGGPLLLYAVISNSVTFGTPSGWAVVESATNSGGITSQAFSKTATGSESGSLTLTANGSGSTICYAGAILDYSGAAVSPFGSKDLTTSGLTSGTSSTAAGTLSPAPGASDLVVRCYFWCGSANATGPTIGSPGGTWTTRLNLVTKVASAQNAALIIADKTDGLDNQTITSTVTGFWAVVDTVIVAGAATAKPRLLTTPLVPRLRSFNW